MKLNLKKSIYLGIMVSSLVLVGCNNKMNNDNTNNKESNMKANENIVNDSADFIGETKAREIALSQVENGEIIEILFDENDTKPNYDIKISDGKYEHEFEIDARDGSIIEISKDIIE